MVENQLGRGFVIPPHSGFMSDADHAAMDLARAVSEQKEAIVLEQLGDLVSRGLLLVESGPMRLTRDMTTPEMKFKVYQDFKLVLRDKEYIEKLEKENERLKAKLASIALALEGIKP